MSCITNSLRDIEKKLMVATGEEDGDEGEGEGLETINWQPHIATGI